MRYLEYQKALQEEVHPRKIEVELSKEECEKLMDLCGSNDITLSKLIGSFIGDLVDGVHSNGINGKDLAQKWFRQNLEKDASDEPKSLLKYIFDRDDSAAPFLELLEDIESAKEDLEEYKKASEEYYLSAEQIEGRKEDLEELNGYYQKFIDDFLEIKPDADIQKEINAVKEWARKKKSISSGYKVYEA